MDIICTETRNVKARIKKIFMTELFNILKKNGLSLILFYFHGVHVTKLGDNFSLLRVTTLFILM